MLEAVHFLKSRMILSDNNKIQGTCKEAGKKDFSRTGILRAEMFLSCCFFDENIYKVR